MKYPDFFYKKSSRIVLGTAYFGDGIGEKESFEIMDKYVSLGGTHIDTARLYADGISEEIVGKWVRSRKACDIQVSTKGGFPTKDNPEKGRLSEKEIRDDLDKSLKALGIDAIDFYWLHQDDETKSAGEIVETMNSLINEGMIRAFGVSNWTTKRIEEAIDYSSTKGLKGPSASQLRFNPAVMNEKGLISRLVGMNKDSFEFYKKNKIPVLAYSSQAKGFFSKMAQQGENALSEKAKLRYLNDENLKTLEVLKELAEKYSCSIASVICGAFSSIEEPEVFPLIGGRTPAQIEDSMNGGNVILSQDEIKRIFSFII